jgi:hypothetical protein
MPRRKISKRTFSYEEALDTFPFVRDLTAAAVRRVEAIVHQLGSRGELDARRAEVEEACEKVVQAWARELTALGCEVKGVWLVDWDSGDGYYCWKFPEESISFFHTYDEGFSGRLPVN